MYLARSMEVEGSIPNWDSLIVSGGFTHSLECGMSSWTSQLVLLFSSGWKWVLVLNHSNYNEFDLHENTSFISIWMDVHQDLFWNRGKQHLGNGLLPYVNGACNLICRQHLDVVYWTRHYDVNDVSFVRKSLWCLSSVIWHDNVTSSFTPV